MEEVQFQQRKLTMAKTVIICGKLFGGLGDTMLGPTEILIEGDTIVEVSGSVGRPGGANVLDLSDRTVSPGFIDTHVHLCVDGLNLARQTLQCSPAKALAGLHYAQQYMRYGFTKYRAATRPRGGVTPPTPRRSAPGNSGRRSFRWQQ
jgi:imidazolonepropionase-like amidohydrolase